MRKTIRRVAIVHDFLYTKGGAERVLEQILLAYPEADLYSLFDFLPRNERGFIQNKPVGTTFLQKMPFARRFHRSYLPLMPLAVEQLDLSKYDVVISSSYVAAKGVITGPDQLHICYCYSPVRYAWDLQHQYLSETGLTRGFKSLLARSLLHYIRLWDLRSSNGVDAFITISNFVARRIQKCYRRDSLLIYPPVDLESFSVCSHKEEFYLTASRMVPYKRIDLIVETFRKFPEKQLVVIGDGPEFDKIRSKAGSNVKLLGYQSAEKLRSHMRRAKAFIFAAEEDFGIAPVEAQACGTPVIAYGRGGATETVIPGRTGLFFFDQTVESLAEAVVEFEKCEVEWDPYIIRRNAERFSNRRFRDELMTAVESEWAAFIAARTQRAPEFYAQYIGPDHDVLPWELSRDASGSRRHVVARG